MGIGSNIKENRNSKTKGNIKDNIFRDGSGSNTKDNSIRVIKGSLFAIITSTIFLIVFAVLLTYTNLSETSITPVVLAVVGISILTGSYFSTRKIQQNGILNGAIVGIVYMLILYIISSMIFMDFSLELSSLIMIGCGMIAGIIGGIIGVKLKNPSNKVLGFILSFASGLMTAIICFDLIPEAFELSNLFVSMIGIIIGIILMIICDLFISNKVNKSSKSNNSLLRTGIVVGIGLALHNFPEGLAIGSGFGTSVTLGISLAIAICLHDVPEGIFQSRQWWKYA